MSEQIVFKDGNASGSDDSGQPIAESAKSTVLDSMNSKLDIILLASAMRARRVNRNEVQQQTA